MRPRRGGERERGPAAGRHGHDARRPARPRRPRSRPRRRRRRPRRRRRSSGRGPPAMTVRAPIGRRGRTCPGSSAASAAASRPEVPAPVNTRRPPPAHRSADQRGGLASCGAAPAQRRHARAPRRRAAGRSRRSVGSWSSCGRGPSPVNPRSPCLGHLAQPARAVGIAAAIDRQPPGELLQRQDLQYRRSISSTPAMATGRPSAGPTRRTSTPRRGQPLEHRRHRRRAAARSGDRDRPGRPGRASPAARAAGRRPRTPGRRGRTSPSASAHPRARSGRRSRGRS